MEFWASQQDYLNDVFTPILIFSLLGLAGVLGLFALGFWRRYRLWRVGGSEDRSGDVAHRLKTVITVAIPHRRILRGSETFPGIMHFLLFWGAVLLIGGKIVRLFGLGGVSETAPPHDVFLYASLCSEIGGGLILVGGVLAVWRRYIRRPARLDTKSDDTHVFVMAFMLVLTGFMIKGYRMATGVEMSGVSEPTDWAMWGPISYGVSHLFLTFDTVLRNEILVWHRVFFHAFLGLFFFAYVFVNRSRMQHIVLSPLNIYFRSLKPKGALTPFDLETAENYGVSKIEHFTWKQLLDLDACTRCGRCQDNCPANLTGKTLSPKQVIQDLREHLWQQGPKALKAKKKGDESGDGNGSEELLLIGDVITEDVLWSCTTCRACMEICPVYVEHVDKIVDMRRNLVLEQASVPETAESILRSIETRGHSCRGTTLTRTDWTTGLEIKTLADDPNVDVLFWTGCQAALEERNNKVAIALAKVMKEAGVNFGIMGAEESCCGEPVRRMGNEYLFQMQVAKNIGLLQGYGVKKIVTACPHCFNTLKHEYPQFEGEFEVVHHTEFIAQLIREGKLKPVKGLDATVTYHDSCYLGRYNDIYKEPREILGHIKGLKKVEMERSWDRGFCCGGGGGAFWLENRAGVKINDARTEQAMETGADVIATACPYCLQMFVDGIKTKDAEETVKAMDVAELIADSISRNGQT